MRGWDERRSREFSWLPSVRGFGDGWSGDTVQSCHAEAPALPRFRVKNPARGGQGEARLQKGRAVIQPILHSLIRLVFAEADGSTR